MQCWYTYLGISMVAEDIGYKWARSFDDIKMTTTIAESEELWCSVINQPYYILSEVFFFLLLLCLSAATKLAS